MNARNILTEVCTICNQTVIVTRNLQGTERLQFGMMNEELSSASACFMNLLPRKIPGKGKLKLAKSPAKTQDHR